MCLGGELVDERESTATVSCGIVGKPPSAVVGDDDGDLAVGDGGVEPDGAWRAAGDEGVLGGVGEGLVHRECEVTSGVVVDKGPHPTAEGPTQRGGVLRGRRDRHVQRRRYR